MPGQKRVLSDAEMQALEAQQPTAKRVLSDEEMAQLEQGGASYESPGVSPEGGALANAWARAKDPNRWKAIVGLDSPAKPDIVQGEAPLAMPAAQAPALVANLAGYLGKAGQLPRVARIGANAGIGAVEGANDLLAEGESRLGHMGKKALQSAAMAAPFEVLGAGKDLLKAAGRWTAGFNPSQASAYVSDPQGTGRIVEALQDPTKLPAVAKEARTAINESRKAIRSQGIQNAQQVSGMLEGKTVPLNLQELSGISPEADALIAQIKSAANVTDDAAQAFKQTAGTGPQITQVPGRHANRLRAYLQAAGNFPEGSLPDAATQARYAAAGRAGGSVKRAIEAVEPGVMPLNAASQEGFATQKSLRQGLKDPLTFLKGQSLGRLTKLAEADAATQGGLLDFGQKLSAAEEMAKESGLKAAAAKAVARPGLRAINAVEPAGEVTQPLLESLRGLFSR